MTHNRTQDYTPMAPVLDHVAVTVSDLPGPRRSGMRRWPPWAPLACGGTRTRPVAAHATGRTTTSYSDPTVRATGGAVVADDRHRCFRAPSRAAVDAFHAAGLAAGGRCDGPPGVRPDYHTAYYAAFLLDPDGNRVEAVCHRAAPGV